MTRALDTLAALYGITLFCLAALFGGGELFDGLEIE